MTAHSKNVADVGWLSTVDRADIGCVI